MGLSALQAYFSWIADKNSNIIDTMNTNKKKKIKTQVKKPQKNVFYIILYLFGITALSSCVQIPKNGSSTGIKPNSSTQRLIVNKSYEKLGIPYRYGGSTTRAFDCSGLTQYVYREAGISIPRTTDLQLRQSKTISYQQLLPGDLVFYKTGLKSRHVGIYIGNNQMIHASTGSKRVKTTNITHNYWQQHFTKFGRFVKAN